MEVTNEIILYQSTKGDIKLDVTLQGETVWLTQEQMSRLFGKGRSTITEHISNIFKEGELVEEVVCRDFRLTTQHGAIKDKTQDKAVKHYNLDVIISVGYRVKSLQGTQFRIWATQRLKEYIVKGFTMNDELLKNKGGGGYFEELLERIRDIRSSEKVFYRKVLEIYACSVDYNPNTETTKLFFQTVQNKLHWAVHGHTAAELILDRANAEDPFMGLTNFKGNHPIKNEVTIAKNYLKSDELSILNRLVSAYLDIAEVNALQQKTMTMNDWVDVLDGFIKMSRQNILTDAGKISAQLAEKKALAEYSTYKLKNEDELSEVEKQFLESIEQTQKMLQKQNKNNE